MQIKRKGNKRRGRDAGDEERETEMRRRMGDEWMLAHSPPNSSPRSTLYWLTFNMTKERGRGIVTSKRYDREGKEGKIRRRKKRKKK